MVLKSGKEVDNKINEEKEHDKEERPNANESDHEIEKENDSSPSPIVFNLIVTYKPKFLYC